MQRIDEYMDIVVIIMMIVGVWVSIVLACVLLWMELQQWGDYPWWKTTEAIPQGAFNYDELIQRTSDFA